MCSDKGLSPGRCQAIIWSNAGILLIGPLQTNFSEISIGIQTFSIKKMHFKMSSAKWRPVCLGLNVLRGFHNDTWYTMYYGQHFVTPVRGYRVPTPLYLFHNSSTGCNAIQTRFVRCNTEDAERWFNIVIVLPVQGFPLWRYDGHGIVFSPQWEFTYL